LEGKTDEVIVKVTLAFDEFAVSIRPNTSYSWALKNTRPQVKSNESKREKLNGLLAIDLITAKEYLKLEPIAKTLDIAKYMVNLTLDLLADYPRLQTIDLFLDNNPTHKKKLIATINEIYKERADELCKTYNLTNINQLPQINFFYFAPYSPDDNPVEYDIRLIRQLALHHLPLDTTLEQIKIQLTEKLQSKRFMTATKLQNTLKHIFAF
jgi:transposase